MASSGGRSFWRRWRTEYLPTLQKRRKWEKEKCNLKEGDIILLKSDQLQRNDWPMGIILKTLPSEDGRVRKVQIKTTKDGSSKTFLRPVSEVVLLFSPETD